MGNTKRGMSTKLMAIADPSGLPVAASIASASPHEVTLVQATLDASFVRRRPVRLIADATYDSDPLDAKLAEQGIEMIAPNRASRRVQTQDGRPLRQYRRPWKIERLFACLQNFQRIECLHEYRFPNYFGFVQLGYAPTLLRRCF